MTCNPNWKEILDALEPGQKPEDRPDVCVQVFHTKLAALIDDLKCGRPWCQGTRAEDEGKDLRATYHFAAVEFQKRGLPHAHIVVRVPGEPQSRARPQSAQHPTLSGLQSWRPVSRPHGAGLDLKDPSVLNEHVRAEHPDPGADEDGFRLVRAYMRHRHSHRCTRKGGGCQYRFPLPYQEESHWDESSDHVTYRRRSLHEDDSNVVEHNLWLLRKYRTHINVRAVTNLSCVAYLFKYLFKPEVGDEKVKARNVDVEHGGCAP